jgi:formyltetrahydrofolate synthetase
MKLQVLKILPILNNNTFQVVIEIGTKQHQFTMTVETDNLCNQVLQIIQGDDKFRTFFQWHRELAEKIYELVATIYNQEPLDFPVSLGEFDIEQPQNLSELLRVNA